MFSRDTALLWISLSVTVIETPLGKKEVVFSRRRKLEANYFEWILKAQLKKNEATENFQLVHYLCYNPLYMLFGQKKGPSIYGRP